MPFVQKVMSFIHVKKNKVKLRHLNAKRRPMLTYTRIADHNSALPSLLLLEAAAFASDSAVAFVAVFLTCPPFVSPIFFVVHAQFVQTTFPPFAPFAPYLAASLDPVACDRSILTCMYCFICNSLGELVKSRGFMV